MTTPAVLYVDDRSPLIFYSPNSSWTRGGNASGYDGTSTFTGTAGATASITFSGTSISALGTIERLDPNIPEFVLSSYSVDGGPTTIYNATEQAQFQFQQLFFQSGPLVSGSHTLVVTQLGNKARLFIDFFMIVPPNSPSTLAPTSIAFPTTVTFTGPASTVIMTSSASDSAKSHSGTNSTAAVTGPTATVIITQAAGDGAKSESGTTPTAAIIGGSLGAFALIGIAVFAFFFIRTRGKNNLQSQPPPSQPFSDLPSNLSPSATEPYRDSPGGMSYGVSSRLGTVSQFSYPTPSSPSQRMIPPSKAAQDARYAPVSPFYLDNSSNSEILSEPPRYER